MSAKNESNANEAQQDAGSWRFAIVRTGGKQYQVAVGDRLKVELLEGKEGEEIELSDILLLAGEEVLVGTPVVENARVVAAITAHGRHDKIVVFKKKRRKGYQVKRGHKQHFTALHIKRIDCSAAR